MQLAPSIKLKNDGTITIATGHDRRETKWKNQELSWSSLLDRLSTPQRTQETQEEYKALAKGDRDNIKDVGGFVGGVLRGGRRKTGSVTWRQLVTLDADYATRDTWDRITLLWDCAAAVYSTHSHTPGHARLRLLLPLIRPVSPEEYQAISRRIAADIGIDLFDDTTYQAHRLMYWPSVSVDGEYLFDYQDGSWLDPDAVLARYEDWQDPAEWPESGRTQTRRKKLAERQGDPLDKPGLVGQFCRAYSIEEAIETFLQDVYSPAEIQGRYTYAKGSTMGGLVLYDDGRFAYSHHATDPISESLVNAFDLVRIHKYSEQDEDVTPGTPTVRLPSYKMMLDLVRNDKRVTEAHNVETLTRAREEFGTAETGQSVDATWMFELDVNRAGEYDNTINNMVMILEHDPLLAGAFAFNAFTRREVLRRSLPWRPVQNEDDGDPWRDADDAELRHYIETAYQMYAPSKLSDATAAVCDRHVFHPVRDYLEATEWDKTPRADTLLIDYLGAADTPYTRAVTRKALCAAVARVYRPGVKYDNMLVLVGRQGIGKSYLLSRLGGRWYSDSLSSVQGKEAYEQVLGFWVFEMGELAVLKRAEVEAVKHFISKQEDSFRQAYGRRTERFPRQCVFFGTTNNLNFLRDQTGNRRFWPVDLEAQAPTRSLFKGLTAAEVDQVWAEARTLYKAGESLYLSPDVEAEAVKYQEAHLEDDPLYGIIQEYLDKPLPSNWAQLDVRERRAYLQGGDFGKPPEGGEQRERVCVTEIWQECLGRDPGNMQRYQAMEIHDLMMRMPGWSRAEGKIKFSVYGAQRGYVREERL
jgi:predicted P-loop ATPase